MWIAAFFITLVLLIASVVANIRALNKIEQYENYCSSLKEDANRVLSDMRKIDIKGSFETDDEVGIVFSTMKQLVAKLGDYV